MATYFMVIGLDAAKDFLLLNNGFDIKAYLIYSEDGVLQSFSTAQ
jgi:hypothetical protein